MHIAAILLAGWLCWVDETPSANAASDKQQAQRDEREFAQFAAKAAESYEICPVESPDNPFVLRAEPILNWSNPEHGRIYGRVFVWTAEGRPEAIASIYKWYHPHTHSSHELQSLALGGLQASREGREAWNVRGPGIKLQPLPEAPPPGKTAPERLRQMRDAARRFRVEATSREGDRAPLRLLTAPLYRYEAPEGELVDGALFAFVEATDPDAILLLEARREKDSSLAWHYALARLNSVQLQAYYQNREIWSAPELPWRQVQDRTQPYFSLRIDD